LTLGRRCASHSRSEPCGSGLAREEVGTFNIDVA
jgi:hypothetical protein